MPYRTTLKTHLPLLYTQYTTYYFLNYIYYKSNIHNINNEMTLPSRYRIRNSGTLLIGHGEKLLSLQKAEIKLDKRTQFHDQNNGLEVK